MNIKIPRVGALLVCLTLLSGCKEELFTNLSELEANQIVAALLETGIPASKAYEGDGVTVMVETSRFSEAMAILESRGLPQQQFDSFGDVFSREGIVSSPVEERARYIYALSQELSRTISEFDGVLTARIHVVLPETDMLGRDFQASRASVAITHSPDAPVAQFTSQIKLLVANSIEGLVYENVTVVAVPAAVRPVPAGQAPDMVEFAGLWVHPGSVSQLQMTLGGLAGFGLIGFATALTMLFTSRRRAARDDDFDGA